MGEARRAAQQDAINFFLKLAGARIPRIAIENPAGIMGPIMAAQFPNFKTQTVQPFYFGDEQQKKTILWLKNLLPLEHAAEDDLFLNKTHVGAGEIHVCKSGNKIPKWYAYADKSKGQAHRALIRSTTPQGLALAMAAQWGGVRTAGDSLQAA